MNKRFTLLLLFLSVFLLFSSSVLGETATYSSTFTAPLCTSGDYTSSTPCSSGTLLDGAGANEDDTPNTIDSCNNDATQTNLYIEELTAYDTDGDGKLENGDTIQIGWSGKCITGDPVSLIVAYSLNPDATTPTWTLLQMHSDNSKNQCQTGGVFDSSTSAISSTNKKFVISGDPEYVAIRVTISPDRNRDSSNYANACWTSTSRDSDDLVIQLYSASSQTITSTSATDIGKTNVTLQSTFTYEDATWVDAYWVIDDVNKTKTNYTTGTNHNVTFTGLDWETTYNYKLCTDSDVRTICSTEKSFTTANRTPPYINIANVFDITQTTASIGGTFFFEDFTNITAYAVLDGVNQTQTLYASGTSQYHSETITNLTHNTLYEWDFCISYEDGELCEGGGNYTTLDYTPPSINSINAFDITNHEASLGASILYNDFTNFTLTWYLDGGVEQSFYYEQEDEFDTSIYNAINLTGLDYSTIYTYDLELFYTDMNYSIQNVTTCEAMVQLYNCNGLQLHSYGYTWDTEKTYEENALICQNLCSNDNDNTCCVIRNGYCYGHDGVAYFNDDGSDFAGNCTTTEESTGSIQTFNTTGNFTTEDPYPPYFTIYTANDITGTSATLSMTFYVEDYPSVIPYFTINGIEQENKTNISVITEPYTYELELEGLTPNTTYNYTPFIGYDLGWSNLVTDDTKTFTTPLMPLVTFHSPTLVNANDVTLQWTIDYVGTTNVEYKFKDNTGDWLPVFDGLKEDYLWDDLDSETTYDYYLQIKYDYNTTTYYFNTSNQEVTTYYENAFDDVWDTLFNGSNFVKILLGFVVLLAIVFGGATAFGRSNLQLGTYGFLVLAIIGSTIATLMNLFSVGIFLLIIGGSIILVMIKNMFFNAEGGGM